MILCIGTTPAAQRVMVFHKLEIDAVNRATTTLDGAAGKSINVAKVLAALGIQPVAMGFVGGDRGNELLAILASRGIDTDFVPVAAPTRLCISVLDQSSQAVTELVEESKTVAASDYEALKARIQKRLPDSEAIVMSGSLTPGGPIDFYRQITQAARELGILTLVDAQGPPLIEALKAKPALVKPNRAELAATVGRSLPNECELIAAMREVLQRGAERIVVTAGKLPILALDERSLWRIHAPTVPVVNPIGSGDAFTAGLVSRLVRKETLGEACRWAAAAGAANALSVMPGELDRRDVERLANDVTIENL
jgi:1-phosphofructokinase family hexose kinase